MSKKNKTRPWVFATLSHHYSCWCSKRLSCLPLFVCVCVCGGVKRFTEQEAERENEVRQPEGEGCEKTKNNSEART